MTLAQTALPFRAYAGVSKGETHDKSIETPTAGDTNQGNAYSSRMDCPNASGTSSAAFGRSSQLFKAFVE
jgi:hypothetical protein